MSVFSNFLPKMGVKFLFSYFKEDTAIAVVFSSSEPKAHW